MHIRYLSAIDTNLLVALDALLEARSVSRAAKRLNRSQPAMSRILARLRDTLDDPILVREGRSMVPSPRALALQAPLRRALADLASSLTPSIPFDPSTSEREFRLCSADYAQVALLGQVRHTLCALGSHVRLRVLPETARFQDLLEEGRADLAVGPQPDRGWIDHEVVTRAGWCCAVAASTPMPKTIEDFAAADHLVVGRDGGPTFVDEALGRMGLQRRVSLWVPDFAGALFVVAASDLVMSLPAGLAPAAKQFASLQISPHPMPLPEFDICMSWHARNTNDAGLAWFKSLVRTSMHLPR